MDQLKQSMAAAGKYGFWISTVVITLGSVGVWFMTTSKLSDENQQRASSLKSDIQSVTQVRSALPTHPNQHSHSKMEELIDGRQAEVLEAWTSVFERQQSILKWPRELQEDFVEEFEGLIPIERFIDFPPTPEQQKNTDLLFRYATYIGTTLPRIAEIAKTEWTAEFQAAATPAGGMGGYGEDMGDFGMGGYSMGGPSGPGGQAGARRRQRGEKEPLVRWSRASQQQVMSDLFPWLGQRPSTLQVYYSQENIWILKQLLQIIANVNGDANQPFQAKIREISRIGIGASVDFEMGNLAQPGEGRRAGGMGGYGIEGGMGGMYDSDAMGDMYSSEGMGEGQEGYMMDDSGGGRAAAAAKDPAENRYVDMQNQPITASTLRAALTSNRPEDAPIAVAKRVPVMMRVKMDQRFVPQLIAACGSAPLMVEVRRVRILPPSSRPGGGGDMGGSGMGGGDMGYGSGDMGYGSGDMGYGEDYGMGGEGDYGDPGGYGGSGAGGQTGGRQGKSEEFPLDVDVEVYGLIYIYNPPDPEKLGLEQVTEDTVIDGSTTTGDQAPVAPEEPTEPAEPALPDEPTADPPVETPGPPAAGETQPDDADPQDADDAPQPESELPPLPEEPGDTEAAEPAETADPPEVDSPVAAAAP